MEEDGIWRTICGRKVFIKNGQSLSDAMRESGKFDKEDLQRRLKKRLNDKNNYEKPEDFNCLEKYKNMSDEDYKKSYNPNLPDYILQDMAKENGFAGLPKVVFKKEYEKIIKSGNIRIQRVISDDKNNSADYYIKQFKEGKYYSSNSKMYGSGIYTSGNESDIDVYSKRGSNSKVIHMAIDKNSNFEEKNNSYEDLKFIYDFVEEARRKEKIKEMDNKYIEFANKYKDKALEMNKEYGELY